jgi:hypothetical protein
VALALLLLLLVGSTPAVRAISQHAQQQQQQELLPLHALPDSLAAAGLQYSSAHTACAPAGGLSPGAAAAIASSLSGDRRVHVSAVRLSGPCTALSLLHGGCSSSSSTGCLASSSRQAAVLLSGNAAHGQQQAVPLLGPPGPPAVGSATAPTSFTAAAAGGLAAEEQVLQLQQLSGPPAATNSSDGDGAISDAGTFLHIDFLIAEDAPFFADLVLQYSSAAGLASSSSSRGQQQPLLWIQPAGSWMQGQRVMLLPASGADSSKGPGAGAASSGWHKLSQVREGCGALRRITVAACWCLLFELPCSCDHCCVLPLLP